MHLLSVVCCCCVSVCLFCFDSECARASPSQSTRCVLGVCFSSFYDDAHTHRHYLVVKSIFVQCHIISSSICLLKHTTTPTSQQTTMRARTSHPPLKQQTNVKNTTLTHSLTPNYYDCHTHKKKNKITTEITTRTRGRAAPRPSAVPWDRG